MRQCIYQKDGQADQQYAQLQQQVCSGKERITQLEKTKLPHPSALSTGSVTEQLRDMLNRGSAQWNDTTLKGHELLAIDH